MPCFKIDKNDLKVGYLNVNCLKDALHLEYIDADKNLLNLHLLCLSDTRLTPRDSSESLENSLKNWKIVSRADSTDGRVHMGLLALTPKEVYLKKWRDLNIKFSNPDEVKTDKGDTLIQLIHCSHYDETISFIYCRRKPNVEESVTISRLIDSSHCVLGDFNLNPEVKDDKRKLDTVCKKTKVLHLKTVTTVWRNQLDHVLIDRDMKYRVYSDSYYNLASDHKSIVMRTRPEVSEGGPQERQLC